MTDVFILGIALAVASVLMKIRKGFIYRKINKEQGFCGHSGIADAILVLKLFKSAVQRGLVSAGLVAIGRDNCEFF